MSDEPTEPHAEAPTAEAEPHAEPQQAAAEASTDDSSSKKATPADVVLHYVGDKKQLLHGPLGHLPARDLTRGEVPQYIPTADWLKAVVGSGLYEPVAGTRIVLPGAPDAPQGK